MTSDPPRIRPATPADLDAILAVAAASPEAPHWPPSSYEPYLSPRDPSTNPAPNPALLRTAWVAAGPSLGTPILGFACATLLADGQENRCELDTLAVLPAARRHGLGAALLSSVRAWAVEREARRLTLEVRASNAAAVRLYEHSGLRCEGRRPRYYADPEEDALILGIALP